MYVRRVTEAARMACLPDHALLRPVLIELRRRHPARASLMTNPMWETLMAACDPRRESMKAFGRRWRPQS